MKLDFSQIQSITCGAVSVQEQADGIHFHRFTGEQEMLYKDRSPDYYKKAFATSGIALRFRTDSETLSFSACVAAGSSRRYFAFEILVNGVRIGVLSNFDETAMTGNYTAAELSFGAFSKAFALGTGDKEVKILFPWSVAAVLQELTLDDGATVTPVKAGKKILCYGDSITQGYDALYPSSKYMTRCADLLGAEEYNKAIGGEVFWPPMAATWEPFTPDYVWVAYGTNDWRKTTHEQLIENCAGFYDNICRRYPDTPVYALTPIWRKDCQKDKPLHHLAQVDAVIRAVTKKYSNVVAISAYDFVPKDEAYYADLRLHPNEKGFAEYYRNLAEKLKPQQPLWGRR